MATPTIQQGRLITKRSAIPGVVPTVPAVDDIETFVATDIFKGELFYNIPDNILYIRDNTGIIIISSGGAPIPYVYYTENTTPGSEEAVIDVTSGTNNGSVSVSGPNNTTANWTDGTNIYQVQMSSAGSTLIANDGSNSNGFTTDLTSSEMVALNGTDESRITLNNDGTSTWVATDEANIEVTDGTDTSFVKTKTNQIESKSSNGFGDDSRIFQTPGNVGISTNSGTNYLAISTNDVYMGVGSNISSFMNLEEFNVTILDPLTSTKRLKLINGSDNVFEVVDLGNGNGIYIDFNTPSITNQLLNGSIINTVTDGTNTSVFTIEPNRIRNSINLGDPTQYEKEVNITGGVISEQMTTSGVGAYTSGINAENYYIQLNNGAGKIKRIELDNLSNLLNIRCLDNTDLSEIIMSPTDITNTVTDGTDTTVITQTPTSISITGIGSYSSDSAAGTAGLVAGNVYQTDGTGSGIFATPGILMIKQ